MPAPLVFGANRIQNAQKRLAFFDAEIAYQQPHDGDGALQGHAAISEIREDEKTKGAARSPAIIFNLTGNGLECDRTKYVESGSNGILPKPTKISDLQALLCLGIPEFVAKGICVERDGGVFMVNDTLRIGTVSASPAS